MITAITMILTWLVLPVLLAAAAVYYLFRKINNAVTYFAGKKAQLTKKKRIIISIAIFVVMLAPMIISAGDWFIILLHFTAFLLICDGIFAIIKIVKKSAGKNKVIGFLQKSGIIAAAITIAVTGYARYNIFNVVKTDYNVTVQKHINNDYKIVFLSDLHYGITLDKAQLSEVADRISAENADIIILGGDIVDENTTYDQMRDAFEVLGKIANTKGIYYIYGNHDKNTYTNSPAYSVEQLSETIKQNGINILEDETADIGDDLVLIGRADRGDGNESGRKSVSELTKGLDDSRAWLILDHQPSEYSQLQDAKCDMVISGHTHAGQIFPAGFFIDLLHLNELNYGYKVQNDLNEIVSSGMAGWGFALRTEKHSEYVTVQLNGI